MLTAFTKRLRTLPRDDRAATAVEFAMLVGPLLFMIMASLQMFLIFYAGQVLQTVTTESARQVMTGQAQDAGDTAATFKTNVVCPNVQFLFTCSAIMVDVESASTYSTLNTSALTPHYDINGNVTNTWQYNPGGPGSIVILRLMYDWPVIGGPAALGLANQGNGSHLLVGTSVFKSEPYQ